LTSTATYRPPPYSDAWREYRMLARSKWRAVLLFFLGALPSGLLLQLVARGVFGRDWSKAHRDVLIFLAGAPWLAYAGYWLNRVSLWRCPRCERPFFVGRWYADHFSRHCVNCGLQKWSES
jgi:hypothetical protein